MTKGLYYGDGIATMDSEVASREKIYFISESLFLLAYIASLDPLTCIQRKEKVKEFDWRNYLIGGQHAYIVPDGAKLDFASIDIPGQDQYEMLPPTGTSTQVLNSIGWRYVNLFAGVSQERVNGWNWLIGSGTWQRNATQDSNQINTALWIVAAGSQTDVETFRVPTGASQGGGAIVSIKGKFLQAIGEALVYDLFPSCWAPGNSEFQVVNPPDPEYNTSEFVLDAQTVLANHSLPLNKITFKAKKS